MDEEEQEELLQMQNKDDANVSEADPLKQYLKGKKQEALNYISMAAKLVAPFIDENIINGYDYTCEALKAANLPEVESEMEIAKVFTTSKIRKLRKLLRASKALRRRIK